MVKAKWITQKDLAEELNVSLQVVHNWISRGHVRYKVLPNSTQKLVDRTSVSVNKYAKRKENNKIINK